MCEACHCNCDAMFDGIEHIAIDFGLSINPEHTKLKVRPKLKLTSPSVRLLVASLEIDGHELIPSCRVVAEAGEREYLLPEMSIIRPEGCGGLDLNKVYKFCCKFHADEEVIMMLEQERDLSGATVEK